MQGLMDLATYLAPTVSAVTAASKEAGTTSSAPQRLAPRPSKPSSTSYTGPHAVAAEDWRSPVYGLIAACVACYLLGQLMPLQQLALSLGRDFRWWQVLTSGFLHSSAQHLAETAFMVYTFGRLLERAQGGWALWATYIASAIGASLFAAWLLPAKAGSGLLASTAAAVGVFCTGLFWPRLSRKPLEVLALTPWVVYAATARYMPLRSSLVVNGTQVGHLVHLGGAVLAATVVAGLLAVVNLVQDALEQQRLDQERQEQERLRAQRTAADGQAVADAVESAARAASAIAKKLL